MDKYDSSIDTGEHVKSDELTSILINTANAYIEKIEGINNE